MAHQKANYDNPRKSPLVRQVMKGIRRTKGMQQRQATPLLPRDLKAISQDLPDRLSGLRDRALLLLGFAGAFRRSELVGLKVSDVSFVDNGLEVVLRRSKTDQEGKGEKKGIPFGSDPATCPVRALRAWLSESHLLKGALFRAIDKYGNLRLGTLTGRSVARIIKLRAQEIGLPAEFISGHSLRSGLATAAARAGKSAHAIMRQTGHKSLNMVQKYVREATLFADNAASGIGL
jgi:integrase